MPTYPFSQVNVFSSDPLMGNPLAVVHAADDLSDSQMLALARWTNLSETVFLLQPSDPEADYWVRIFTPAGELPFAGHPTLGACHAWLSAGGCARNAEHIVQQCAAGLVKIRRQGVQLAFAAPPMLRTGPLDAADVRQIAGGLGLSVDDIVHHQWVDNGPSWCAVVLESAASVLSIKPDWHESGSECAIEVRALVGHEACEDPVTGSLNASLAQWLIGAGLLPDTYIASQGTAMQRAGRIHLHRSGQDIWVGGQVVDVIKGEIDIPGAGE